MSAKILKIGPWKQFAIAAAGFGFGGLLWGLEAYRGTVGAGESFTNPFSYILGAVALAVFGGIALAYTKRGGAREAAKIIGLGLVGWLVAFALPAVGVEWWFLVGGGFLSAVLLTPISFLLKSDIVSLVSLEPSLIVGHLWFEFFLTGAIVGLTYSLIFKSKILRSILWGTIGFALASLISPILGNLIGGSFNSLLASYILTFVFLCVIIGICVYGGIYGSSKKTPKNT